MFRRWVGWTVAGETAGFSLAALTGAIATAQDLSAAVMVALLLLAGAGEGALLGAGQSVALRSFRLPPSTLRRWWAVTSAAATLAWAIGLLPSTIPWIPWSHPLTWLVAVALAALLLGSIPTAQFLLLRSAIPGAWRWIPVNAVAWLVGLGWTMAPSPLVDARTPLPQLIALYCLAGLLMALTVATITGLQWLRWLKTGAVELVDERPPRSAPHRSST